MGLFATGQVVVLPFPYSDLTKRKLRPAVLLAASGYEDWIICQVTSNPLADNDAIALSPKSFISGGLHHISYARPSKLVTVHQSLFTSTIGTVTRDVLEELRNTAAIAIRRD